MARARAPARTRAPWDARRGMPQSESATAVRRIARSHRAQELELLTGPGGKSVRRMTDDIGVNVFGEVEANRESARIRIGVASGITGTPVEFEKRTVTGVDSRFRWGARVREAAAGEGVKLPFSRAPLAWAGRNPGCSPKMVSNCRIRSWLRAIMRSSVGRGKANPSLGPVYS